MAPKTWQPPQQVEPSAKHIGHETTAPNHSAVGKALSQWEHMESAMIKMFQVFCETPGYAACRAYSTVVSGVGRAGAMRAAASSFYENPNRSVDDLEDVNTLLNAYIQTTKPNEVVKPIHPTRMPVILDPADYEAWLTGSADEAIKLARPFPADQMRVAAVGNNKDNWGK